MAAHTERKWYFFKKCVKTHKTKYTAYNGSHCAEIFLVVNRFFMNLSFQVYNITGIDVMTNNAFGNRLAMLRKEKGLTQKELADKIGLSWRHIADYERGKARLNDSVIYRIATELKISADDILGIKDRFKNSTPSLRLMRRLNIIEQLSPARQKKILSTLDDLIKAAKTK